MLCMDRVKLMSGVCRLPSSRASDLRGVLVVGQPTRRSPRVSVRQSFSSAFSAPVNDVHVEVHACLSRKKKRSSCMPFPQKKEVHACLPAKRDSVFSQKKRDSVSLDGELNGS
jgi:hypothetical protein